MAIHKSAERFWSTRSAWERNQSILWDLQGAHDFNPLAPRGSETGLFSAGWREPPNFNPLAPRGSETPSSPWWHGQASISIHSLRVRARQQTPTKRQAFFHHNNTTSTNKCQTARSVPPFLPPSPTPLPNFPVRRSWGNDVCLGFAQKSSPPQRGAGCRVEAHTNGGEIRKRSSGWTGAGRRRRRTP